MEHRRDRWYPFLSALFAVILVVSNIIAVKLVQVGGMVLPAAVVLFPLAYVLGDVLTEVYGYAYARRVIWTGFFANLVAVAAIWVGGWLPAAPFWDAGLGSAAAAQRAYRAILGFMPRLLLASFVAYLVGEFLNAYVLAKLKVRTGGRFLWLRTIGSTIVGEGADTLVFITLAFYGIIPTAGLVWAVLSQWGVKVAYETLVTPLTYLVVNALKRAEGVDHFDRDTDFRPWVEVL
ncbi:MAG TPA: queuosine precursor transporter [Anaerolineae bacterium]|nr:queuosine precursor transporter [Anaerolineae bacterium]HID83591.1 VUT family protein [Anaerolineales bacterium]